MPGMNNDDDITLRHLLRYLLLTSEGLPQSVLVSQTHSRLSSPPEYTSHGSHPYTTIQASKSWAFQHLSTVDLDSESLIRLMLPLESLTATSSPLWENCQLVLTVAVILFVMKLWNSQLMLDTSLSPYLKIFFNLADVWSCHD